MENYEILKKEMLENGFGVTFLKRVIQQNLVEAMMNDLGEKTVWAELERLRITPENESCAPVFEAFTADFLLSEKHFEGITHNWLKTALYKAVMYQKPLFPLDFFEKVVQAGGAKQLYKLNMPSLDFILLDMGYKSLFVEDDKPSGLIRVAKAYPLLLTQADYDAWAKRHNKSKSQLIDELMKGERERMKTFLSFIESPV